MKTRLILYTACLAAGLLGCTNDFDGAELQGEIPFEPERPSYNQPPTVPQYAGTNDIVLKAQEDYKTGLDLHQKIIYRTCTPFDGVCHNQKEYPDLHTPAAFQAIIGAPCNLQSGEWESVYDRCEQLGDRFSFNGGAEIEIGWLEFKAAEGGEYDDLGDTATADSPGLHIYLRSPLDFGDRSNQYGTGAFVRTFVNDQNNVEDLSFATLDTRWYVLGDGTHILGQIRNYQVDNVEQILDVGIIQGDLNRNGVYGARETEQVPMINPGDPDQSYLIARLRGVMLADEVPGSRMPLANQPLDISEMLALFCFVEGLGNASTVDLSWDIDYQSCSYSADPENLNLLGEGVTWTARVSKVLEFNCGGCHSEPSPAADLNLIGDEVYGRLLEPSLQNPTMPLISPGDPANSYLFLKLIGDETITGTPMPFNPLTGEGTLKPAEIADIETWIINGAVENE